MNIEEVLDDLGVATISEGNKHTTAGWLQANCPFCFPPDTNYKLGIVRDGFAVNCWSCGSHKLGDTLAALSGRPLREVMGLLGKVTRGPVSRETKPRGKLVLPAGLGDLLPPHRKYLKKRGLDPDELAAGWGVRGIGPGVRLAWRIWIPVRSGTDVVSWTTRAIGPSPYKYLSAKPTEEAVSHKDLLLGEDRCRNAVIVHEGPMDVFSTGPGAVCTFGTRVSVAQVRRIARFPVRVVCFDGEPEAQRQADRLCDELSCFPGNTTKVVLQSAKDANEASAKELRALRKMLR